MLTQTNIDIWLALYLYLAKDCANIAQSVAQLGYVLCYFSNTHPSTHTHIATGHFPGIQQRENRNLEELQQFNPVQTVKLDWLAVAILLATINCCAAEAFQLFLLSLRLALSLSPCDIK